MAVSTNSQQISLGEFSRSALLFLNESLNTYLQANNSIPTISTQYPLSSPLSSSSIVSSSFSSSAAGAAASSPSSLSSSSSSLYSSSPFSNQTETFINSSSVSAANLTGSAERTPGNDGFAIVLLWSALFYPMVVTAAAGNLLVIWIIAMKPMMRTVMNRYLLNLTISDFLSITLNASFNFFFMLNEHWPFGHWYCVANNFIANLTIASSVCTIMLISLDRYYAIVHPLRPRQSYRRLLVSITVIWAFSALISLPTLFYSTTLEVVVGTPSDEPLNSIPPTMIPPTPTIYRDVSGTGPFQTPTNSNVSSILQHHHRTMNAFNSFNATEHATNHDIIALRSIQTVNNNGMLQHQPQHRHQQQQANHHHHHQQIIPSISSNTDRILFALLAAQSGQPVEESPIRNIVRKRTLCVMHWPDGYSGFSFMEFCYNLAFTFFLYLVPLTTMVVALVLMSRVLWPREGMLSEHTSPPQQHALIRSKRKVVCMLTCVITVFAVCWAPYHAYFIITFWFPSIIQKKIIKHIYLAFYWFAMANSLFNPIILFAMNRRIRNYVMYYLKFTCCPFGLYKMFSRDGRRLDRRCSSIQVMMRKDNYRIKNRAHNEHHHGHSTSQHLSQHRPLPVYYRAQSTMGGLHNSTSTAPEMRRHCCSVNDLPDQRLKVPATPIESDTYRATFKNLSSDSDRNSESGASYSGWTLTGPWTRRAPTQQPEMKCNGSTSGQTSSACEHCCDPGLATKNRWQFICSCGRAEFSKPDANEPPSLNGQQGTHPETNGVFLNRQTAFPVIKTSSRSLFQLFHWTTITPLRDTNNNTTNTDSKQSKQNGNRAHTPDMIKNCRMALEKADTSENRCANNTAL